ncbi:hypothetical protein Tco_0155587 [Tanacetum coccineum]
MTTLQFADTHNLVAFLVKPAESEGFEQIVDFINAHTIKYALTVNPLDLILHVLKQFWATVKVKTVNGEEGMDCLPNATIFEELTRMGVAYKAVYEERDESVERSALLASSLDAEQDMWGCILNMGGINDIDKDAEINCVDVRHFGSTTLRFESAKVQAKIEADCLLGERLQAREQEELTIEERAILFQNSYRKKVNTFVDYKTELVEGSSEKAKADIAQESSSKRAGYELE